jgi:hypothetical protein
LENWSARSSGLAVLDGRRRASREHRVYTSEPGYGRRVAEDGRSLLVDEREEATAKRAVELREAGASFRAICRHLDKEGFRPRRAVAWSPTVIRRVVLRATKVAA